jgi:pyridoxal phosphate enzyme (YggS family)
MSALSAAQLRDNLTAVHERIARACERAGRAQGSVALLAVSKGHGPDAIRAAYALGQREFGENYAQELADKARALADLTDLRLRFIGGLQRNKLKLLAPLGCAIETLAGAETARALHERLAALGRRCEVMIQVNVAAEAQKSGIAAHELAELVAEVRALPSLELRGLMTIPKAADPAGARASYRQLRELAAAHGLRELSMGMSDDLEVAVEEGATRVRVGTAIFGPRLTRARA